MRHGGAWLRAVAVTLLLGAASPLPGQVLSGGVQRFVSSSGQFTATGKTSPNPSVAYLTRSPGSDLLLLEPSTAVISLERTRELLLRELGMTDPGGAKVHLGIRPVIQPEDQIYMVCNRFLDRWEYRVSVPAEIPADRLLEAWVRILLTEWVSRRSETGSFEIPVWLVVGLAEHLKAAYPDKPFFIDSVDRRSAQVRVSSRTQQWLLADRWKALRRELLRHHPPTFDDLSWNLDQYADPDSRALYRQSAHFLVHRLLTEPLLRQGLGVWLAEMPRYLNWQTAFLQVYAPYFPSLLQLEKWWSVQVVQASTVPWGSVERTSEASLAQMREILRTPVQVRTSTNALPIRAVTTLQSCLPHWDAATQRQVVEVKLAQLRLAKPAMAWEVHLIADGYIQVLERFLARRPRAQGEELKRLLDATVAELRRLDQIRDASLPVPAPGPSRALEPRASGPPEPDPLP